MSEADDFAPGGAYDETSNPLHELRDQTSTSAFGMTREQAWEKGVCIQCKEPDPWSRCHDEASEREYAITAICGECWDKMFPDEEDDDR